MSWKLFFGSLVIVALRENLAAQWRKAWDGSMPSGACGLTVCSDMGLLVSVAEGIALESAPPRHLAHSRADRWRAGLFVEPQEMITFLLVLVICSAVWMWRRYG